MAVALDTFRNPGEPSSNFVGVATSGSASTLRYAATSTATPALRTGSHVIDVNVTAAGRLLVLVDGVQVIDAAVTLPQNVLVGFSGATGSLTDRQGAAGSLTDRHTVTGVRVGY